FCYCRYLISIVPSILKGCRLPAPWARFGGGAFINFIRWQQRLLAEPNSPAARQTHVCATVVYPLRLATGLIALRPMLVDTDDADGVFNIRAHRDHYLPLCGLPGKRDLNA